MAAFHEKVNQRANEISEEDDHKPGNFAATAQILVKDAIDEHPYPENGSD